MPWFVPALVPLPSDFVGYDPSLPLPPENFSSYERHLPHWRVPGACYFITFRLTDSIPASVLEAIKHEAEDWQRRLARASLKNHGVPPPDELAAWHEFQRSRARKLEATLDEGHGECLLCDASHRQMVADALHHFEGTRCEMLAFTVMPNHVHVLCRPLGGHALEDLCGSWKWFTAQKIQRHLGRQGGLWQEESFDRVIRDGGHYANTVRYIARNPQAANLRENEATVWLCQAIQDANG
jgi:putative transposase